jgi:hypothetical protein
MLSWIIGSGPNELANHLLSIPQEIEKLKRTKVLPLEVDFMFGKIYPVGRERESMKPVVGIVSDNDADRRYLIDLLLGDDLHMAHGSSIYFAGEMDRVLPPSESSALLCMEETDLVNCTCVSREGHPILQRLTVLAYSLDVDGRSGVLDEASVIYVVTSCDKPDVSSKMRRFLSKCRPLHDKMRLIIRGPTDSPIDLSQVIWGMAKSLHLPEMPQTYFLDYKESEKDKLFSDLMRIPVGFSHRRLTLLVREARLARAHALLMSYIKGQLPTFNRQSKQDRIADELEEVIRVVSSKSGVPISDFPSGEFLRCTVRSLDFSQLKKLKDTSLQLISEFIDSDSQRLLSKFPQEELTSIATSPERGGLPQPNLSEYSSSFESLNPKDGIASGPQLKEHLVLVSNLPSHTLYRIWRLADKDKDGGLTLKEYSACRELIKHVKAGHDLPKSI